MVQSYPFCFRNIFSVFGASFHNAQVKAGSDGKLLESSRLLRATLVLCLLAIVLYFHSNRPSRLS